jgi:hypothetical protein
MRKIFAIISTLALAAVGVASKEHHHHTPAVESTI